MECTGNIKKAGKLLLKEIIWHLLSNHQQSKKKNICLYASRRSGSSLMMECIASNKRVTFSDQPFGLFTNNPWNLNLLPLFEYGQIISMDKEEEQLVREYIKKIFSGEIYVNQPWKIWENYGFLKSERIVLKITDAKSIIDWVDKNFQVHTVVMLRHPIAQSLSVIRNKWQVTGKAFLRNQHFVENYLTDKQFAFCKDIYKKGTSIERHVADWTLENMIPIKLLPKRPHWIFIRYEDLILYPGKNIRKIMVKLELKNYSKMRNTLKRPSRSTPNLSSSNTQFEIREGNSEYLLGNWKKKITKNEKIKAFKILETLEMKLYAD